MVMYMSMWSTIEPLMLQRRQWQGFVIGLFETSLEATKHCPIYFPLNSCQVVGVGTIGAPVYDSPILRASCELDLPIPVDGVR